MQKRNLAIKVKNGLTQDKRYQRLLKIDEMIIDIRARARGLYQERIKLVEELHGHGSNADNGSSA